MLQWKNWIGVHFWTCWREISGDIVALLLMGEHSNNFCLLRSCEHSNKGFPRPYSVNPRLNDRVTKQETPVYWVTEGASHIAHSSATHHCLRQTHAQDVTRSTDADGSHTVGEALHCTHHYYIIQHITGKKYPSFCRPVTGTHIIMGDKPGEWLFEIVNW